MNFPALLATIEVAEELGMAAPDLVLNTLIKGQLAYWKEQSFTDQHDHLAMQRETSNVLTNLIARQ